MQILGRLAKGVCDGWEQVRERGAQKLGTKVEVKNMNSFSAMQRAIDFEIDRQASPHLCPTLHGLHTVTLTLLHCCLLCYFPGMRTDRNCGTAVPRPSSCSAVC